MFLNNNCLLATTTQILFGRWLRSKSDSQKLRNIFNCFFPSSSVNRPPCTSSISVLLYPDKFNVFSLCNTLFGVWAGILAQIQNINKLTIKQFFICFLKYTYTNFHYGALNYHLSAFLQLVLYLDGEQPARFLNAVLKLSGE